MTRKSEEVFRRLIAFGGKIIRNPGHGIRTRGGPKYILQVPGQDDDPLSSTVVDTLINQDVLEQDQDGSYRLRE